MEEILGVCIELTIDNDLAVICGHVVKNDFAALAKDLEYRCALGDEIAANGILLEDPDLCNIVLHRYLGNGAVSVNCELLLLGVGIALGSIGLYQGVGLACLKLGGNSVCFVGRFPLLDEVVALPDLESSAFDLGAAHVGLGDLYYEVGIYHLYLCNSAVCVYSELNVLCGVAASRSLDLVEIVLLACYQHAVEFLDSCAGGKCCVCYRTLVLVKDLELRACQQAAVVQLGDSYLGNVVLHYYLAVDILAVNLYGAVLFNCESDILSVSVAVRCACLGEGVGLASRQLVADVVRLAFNGIPLVNGVALAVGNYDVCAADLVVARDIGLGDLNIQRLILHYYLAVYVCAVNLNGAVLLNCEGDILGVSVALRCACLGEGVGLASRQLVADVVRLAFNGIPLVNGVALTVLNYDVCAADLVVASDVGLRDLNIQRLILHYYLAVDILAVYLDGAVLLNCEGDILGVSVALRCACLGEGVGLACLKLVADVVRLAFNGIPLVNSVALTVLNYDVCAADLVGACDIGLGDLNVQRLVLHYYLAVYVCAVNLNGAVLLNCEGDILGVSVALRCACLGEGVGLACLKLVADVVRLAFNGIPLVNSVALTVLNYDVCAADLVGACDIGLGDLNVQRLILHYYNAVVVQSSARNCAVVVNREGDILGVSVACGRACLGEGVGLACNQLAACDGV